MSNWLKWLIAGKELAELYRWRVKWEEYRRWLAEFDDVGVVLDNLKAEVNGDGLSASLPPSEPGPWTVDALREMMRKKRPKVVVIPPAGPDEHWMTHPVSPDKVSVSCPSCCGGKTGCRNCGGSGVVQVNAPPRRP